MFLKLYGSVKTISGNDLHFLYNQSIITISFIHYLTPVFRFKSSGLFMFEGLLNIAQTVYC